MLETVSHDPVNDLAHTWHTDTLETEVVLEGLFYDSVMNCR